LRHERAALWTGGNNGCTAGKSGELPHYANALCLVANLAVCFEQLAAGPRRRRYTGSAGKQYGDHECDAQKLPHAAGPMSAAVEQ